MGKAANINCNWCPNAIDTIEHFFYECNKIACIWKTVEGIIYNKTGNLYHITLKDVLFGIEHANFGSSALKLTNHIILIAKMCVGIFKYSTPVNIDVILNREMLLRGLD